jgi:hypothetical protein
VRVEGVWEKPISRLSAGKVWPADGKVNARTSQRPSHSILLCPALDALLHVTVNHRLPPPPLPNSLYCTRPTHYAPFANHTHTPAILAQSPKDDALCTAPNSAAVPRIHHSDPLAAVAATVLLQLCVLAIPTALPNPPARLPACLLLLLLHFLLAAISTPAPVISSPVVVSFPFHPASSSANHALRPPPRTFSRAAPAPDATRLSPKKARTPDSRSCML